MPRDRRGALWATAYTLAGGAVGAAAATVGRVVSDTDFRERLGRGPTLPEGVRPLWLHGASVGEMGTLKPLVSVLERQRPGMAWGITSTTVTGRARADALFPDALFRRLLPIDAWPAPGRFIDAVRPAALIVVETEIWPKLLMSLERRGVPVCLASARMTGRSHRGYRRARGLFRRVLRTIDLIATRSDEDRERFLDLGADPERTVVAGNTKLDVLSTGPSDGSDARTDMTALLGSRHVVVWGCLRPGEEAIAIELIGSLCPRSDALWVIAPRHPEEFDRVATALTRAGIAIVRRSGMGDAVPTDVSVLLVDTLGELRDFYEAADVAIVGGTFAAYGGHNLMEPAAFGVPVVFGPDTSSWTDDAERLLEHDGGVRVHGPGELCDAVWTLLSAPESRQRLGRGAREAADAGRGASGRVIAALESRGFFDAVTTRTP